MSTLKIGEVELELDLLDADIMERYEKLNAGIVEKLRESSQYEGLSAADAMRKQCEHIDGFFDGLFGEGTALKLFGGGANLGRRMDAFGQVAEESTKIRGQMESIVGKYSVGRVQNQTPNRRVFGQPAGKRRKRHKR